MHVVTHAVIRVGNCFLRAHRHRSIMIEDFQTAFLESVHIPDPVGNVEPVVLVPIDRNRWNRQSRAVFIVERYLRSYRMILRVVQSQNRSLSACGCVNGGKEMLVS